MLSFAVAFVSVAMAAAVALFGEERRVKAWFVATCVACAALSVGLWIEMHVPEWAVAAARVNMTAALALAVSGLMSTRAMTRLPVSPVVMILVAIAAVANLATVWATELYFSGTIVEYGWGDYVGANPYFIANPLLVALIAGYAVVILARRYRSAHPLEKNRAKYLFAAFGLLSLSVLDYLPHFGIAPFGAPIGGVFVALFLFLFGYACLRYRLVVFRDLVGRAAGWILSFGAMALAYAFGFEAARRFGASSSVTSPFVATLFAATTYGVLGRAAPELGQRLLGGREPDYARAIRDYSDTVTSNFDETPILAATASVCATTFLANSAELVEGDALEQHPVFAHLADGAVPFVEIEVLRRAHDVAPERGGKSVDVVFPIQRHGAIRSALFIGRRSDGRMYSRQALEAMRTLANVLGMAIASARGAKELVSVNDELRRQVTDRSRQLAEALQRVGAVPERTGGFTIGQRVDDRYRIVRELGRGGMGAVFEVTRSSDDRRFALKVLTAATTGRSLARLAREAEVAGTIAHPNLVAIVDVDVSRTGELYVVMELVDGQALSAASRHFKDLAWVLPVLTQIARGLAALHAAGIVHRDLKPANVLLSRDAVPVAKIADFGIARLGGDSAAREQGAPRESPAQLAHASTLAIEHRDAAGDVAAAGRLTAAGAVMGTPLYMAPELASGAADAAASSDIWSFGVLAYELLVGALPFVSAPSDGARAARAKAVDAFADADRLPAALAAMLARALAIDPADRPTAAELSDALAPAPRKPQVALDTPRSR